MWLQRHKASHAINMGRNLHNKSEAKESAGRPDGEPYSPKTSDIFVVDTSSLIKYQIHETLDIKEEIILDQHIKSESKESTGKLDGRQYSYRPPAIFFADTNTLIKYEIDETLEIKEEIIQDPETTGQKRKERYDLKVCNVDIREDTILDLQIKSESKESTGRPDDGPYCSQNHDIFFANTNTLIKYEIDDSLEISEEFMQDPEYTGQQQKEKYDSKLYTVNLRESVILDMNELQPNLKQKIVESKHEKMHRCQKCGRNYKTKRYLVLHTKFDCGVMPQFACKLCGKRFTRKCNVTRHMNSVHMRLANAAVKPEFMCDFCGHKANRKCNLADHITSRHLQTSTQRYNCDKCLRSYTWSSALNRHKRLEHGAVKPQFICDYCGYKTSMKSSLSRHITSCHLK
ncbi:zinc finger protein 681-like [Belonocnema kinseyi]|uniref:zinc finger protein 681-like n=1 Tax=Belonocnema kinseyi TaxID=2817044 RepID=UPI00143CF9FE|nr:zinc finger protein 681-like [Belonocnema kinseyi]